MLVDSKVKIKWNNSVRKYYVSKGYIFTNYEEEFLVDVNDLPKGSEIKLNFICDYCNKPYQQTYAQYINKNINGIVHKDCCYNCRHLKVKESNLIVYGIDHTSKIPEIAKKLGRDKIPFEKIKEEFSNRGYILLSKEHEYIQNTTILSYLCRKHLNKGILHISYANLARGKRCKQCYLDANSGENNSSWKGGISSIKNYLRGQIGEWKFNTLKKDNFTCVLTGSKKDIEIHHLVGFSIIFDEVMKESKLPIYDQFSKYSKLELDYLTSKIIEKHYYYGLGVCLRKDIHKLFHSTYGNRNNTPEQFYEFKDNYLNGRLLS